MIRPRISVLMPVRDGMPDVMAAVRSIQSQRFPLWELIVVDDGSRDDTAAFLKKASRRDRRIRVFSASGCGITPALNMGLAHVRGRFVARMDADDIAHPYRLALQGRFLADHPDVVAVGSWTMLIDPDGDPLTIQRWPQFHEAIDRALLTGHGGLPHPAAMIRTEAMQEVGGYRESFPVAQDKDLWLRLAERGSLVNLPAPLLYYRLHFGSIGWEQRSEQQQCVARAVQEARRRRGLPDRPIREPRREPNEESVETVRYRWARWAWKRGNYDTARKHLRWLRERKNVPLGARWLDMHSRIWSRYRGNQDRVPDVSDRGSARAAA